MANKKDINLRITAKDAASKTISAINRRFGALSKAVAGVGAAIASYLSVRSITGFFRSAVAEAADLEQQLSRVQAVTRATPEDMARLKAAAEEMGASTKFTATQAAEGMEALGRAGLDVADTLEAIPSVLALAAGQNLELGQSAKIVASAVRGMQESFDQAGRFADVLALAASSANTNVEGLSTALSYASPNAKAAGLEIEQLAAYIGRLNDAGYDGSRAGTALSRMMADFVNPASGMRRALADVGITTTDFTQAMEELQAKGDDALPVIVALGQRAGPALRTLLGQGIEGVKDLTEELRGAEGAAAAAASTMAQNLRGAMTALGSAWSALKINLVDPLLGPITEQVEALTARIRTLATDGSLDRLRASLVSAFDRGVEAVSEFVGSFGTVDEALDRLATGISSTLDWFSRLSNAGKFAGNAIIAAFKGVDSAVSAVATVLTTVITGIAFGIDKVIQALNFLGLASDQTALNSAALVQTLHEMNIELGKRTVQSAKDAGNAVLRATDNILAMGSAAEDAAPKTRGMADATEQAAAASDAAADAFGHAAMSADELRAEAARLESEIDELIGTGADIGLINDSMRELGRVVAEIDARPAAEQIADLAKASDSAAEAQASLALDVERAEAALLDLMKSGAGMDAITAASRDLERAQRALAQETEGVVDATDSAEGSLAAYRAEVAAAKQHLDELTAAGDDLDAIAEATQRLESAQEALAEATETAAGESQAFDERLQELQSTVAAMGIDELRDQMSGLGQAFDDDQISLAEYDQAMGVVRGAMADVGRSTEDAKESTVALGDASEEAGDKAKEAADKGEESADRQKNAVVSLFSAVRNAYAEMSDAMQVWYDQQLARVRSLHEWYSRFNDIKFDQHRAEFEGLADRATRVEDALRSGTFAAEDMSEALQLLNYDTARARSGLISLGDERLIPLRAAIESAQRSMQGMKDEARETVETLTDELLRLQGEEDALAQRQHARRRAELVAQIAEARAQGNEQAARSLTEALALLERIGREEQHQRKERKEEDARRARIRETERDEHEDRDRAPRDGSTDRRGAKRTPSTTETVRWEINVGGRHAGTIEVAPGQENQLEAILRELETASMRMQ